MKKRTPTRLPRPGRIGSFCSFPPPNALSALKNHRTRMKKIRKAGFARSRGRLSPQTPAPRPDRIHLDLPARKEASMERAAAIRPPTTPTCRRSRRPRRRPGPSTIMDALRSRWEWLFIVTNCQRQNEPIYRCGPGWMLPNFFGNSSRFWSGSDGWGDYRGKPGALVSQQGPVMGSAGSADDRSPTDPNFDPIRNRPESRGPRAEKCRRRPVRGQRWSPRRCRTQPLHGG